MNSHTLIGPDKLFPPQAELLAQGFRESTENWLICTPTGSGKTLMAEWALESSLRKGLRGAYLAPLKAIVDERLQDWRTKFPCAEVGLYTGDSVRDGAGQAPREERLLLFTPEKLAAYLSNWKRHLPWLAELDSVVIDELHLLGDNNRGATIEALIGRLQRINPFIRIVGLSGTLSNAEEIASWMGARLFRSEWRPIPVENRIRRFKKVADKPEILLEEIAETLRDNGKVLVFVNSRRRSEWLAEYVRSNGISAECNHAGLSKADRRGSQTRMREGQMEVLIATSTLEMGVNFPARKVVVYDAYGFNGESFAPLTIQRYRQYAGRAGRAGFDLQGEAVLLVPSWFKNATRYLHGDPEPVRSSLFNTNSLLREILCEVSTRLSISEDHLETNFASRTFWRRQDGVRDLGLFTKHLLTAGLIKEKEKGDAVYLSATALGRIATQMQISPRSVTLFADFYKESPNPEPFDLLLIACLCIEATPKLGLLYEEIEGISETLAPIASHLLDMPPDKLFVPGRGLNEKGLLAGLKGAVLIYRHTIGESIDNLAEAYDCYAVDIEMLKRNLGWVLDAAARIFAVLNDGGKGKTKAEETKPKPSLHSEIASALKLTIQYGIPHDSLELVAIPGIGPKRAQALVAREIRSISELLLTPADQLADALKLRDSSILALLEQARAIAAPKRKTNRMESEKKQTATRTNCGADWPHDIDAYRLRRAISLRIDHVAPERIGVSGGSEPHQVRVIDDQNGSVQFMCDCGDFSKGTTNCKHILRARIELKDSFLIMLAERFTTAGNQPIRYSLDTLWMKAGHEYHSIFSSN